MIFAKVDVTLPRHHRMQSIDSASAFGVYVAALCHTREHELDGFVPTTAFRGFPAHSKKDVADLVKAGLFVATVLDGLSGFLINNYAAKNETKADVAERRLEAKERMRLVRANRRGGSPEQQSEQGVVVPGSRSGSVSDLISDPRNPNSGTLTAPPLDIPITAELIAWADQIGAPAPTTDHVAKFLLNMQRKKLLFHDPIAAFKFWMLDEKKHAAKDRAHARTGRIVQTAPETGRVWKVGTDE